MTKRGTVTIGELALASGLDIMRVYQRAYQRKLMSPEESLLPVAERHVAARWAKVLTRPVQTVAAPIAPVPSPIPMPTHLRRAAQRNPTPPPPVALSVASVLADLGLPDPLPPLPVSIPDSLDLPRHSIRRRSTSAPPPIRPGDYGAALAALSQAVSTLLVRHGVEQISADIRTRTLTITQAQQRSFRLLLG